MAAKAVLLSSILIMTQFAVFTNLISAYASQGWDGHGIIAPHKKAHMQSLLHTAKAATKNPAHKYIPIYRHANHAAQKTASRENTVLGNTTGVQYFSIKGVIEGLGYDNLTPPDVQVAAGPDSIMEMINLEGQIWTKGGIPAGPPFGLADFYGTGSDFISDPKVFYDNSSQRWFTSITDVSTDTVKVAVSDSNDPTNSIFCLYSIPSSNSSLPDQPIIGVSNDKFVVSVNDFDFLSGQFKYAQFWVINKGDMLACSPLHYVTKTMGELSFSTPSPVADWHKHAVHVKHAGKLPIVICQRLCPQRRPPKPGLACHNLPSGIPDNNPPACSTERLELPP